MPVALSRPSIRVLALLCLLAAPPSLGANRIGEASESIPPGSTRDVRDARIAGGARGVVLADFESGQVTLESFEDEDQQPNGWSLSTSTTYGGSQYSLKLSGNSWKAQPIAGHAVGAASVFQVAALVSAEGETQGFGVSDGSNTLFYSFAGKDLFTTDRWEVVYQGAFAEDQWNLYLLPVGRDWRARYGYDPVITRLVYCNDRDLLNTGAVYFDAITDITADLPAAPTVQIIRGRQSVEALTETLFRVGVQFHAQVLDPDTPPDSLAYAWDFGDGSVSSTPDPFHDFLVEADHAYTVTLEVRDPQGMRGRDSTRVAVEPGPADLPATMNFVGDVMLARGYDAPGGLIELHGPEWMFIPTKPYFGDDADLNTCNLECPLTDQGTPHPTKSIVFRGHPENVAGLAYAGIDLVTLANNHIIDYGQVGMDQTFAVLDSAGIPWFGAGDDDYGATQPVFRGVRGVSLGFAGQCNRTGREYNYQPFLDAGFNKPGFAWETEQGIDRALAAVVPYSDLAVMQMHSGLEYAVAPGSLTGEPAGPDDPVPTAWRDEPWDQPGPARGAAELPAAEEETFRFPTRPSLTDRELRWHAVDAGADLLICHHPHVLQGFEVYNGVLIAHSLGNFVFDQNYAETYPSLIVKSSFDKEAFRAYTVRPAFVDNLVPQVVSGRLGREILDRQAEYSRELNTVVTVDAVAMQATIQLHPENLEWVPEVFSRTEPLTESSGWWQTPPIEREGAGVLRRILSANAPGTVEVRIGRELLWHGDFENEGATFWDLNSTSEGYDPAVTHQGAQSLRLKRTSGNTGAVTTTLEGYPAALGGREYSVSCWIKTQGAVNAGLAALLYVGRGGSQIGTFEVAGSIDGTQDWTWYWQDFMLDRDGWFLNCRAHLDRPETGEGYAWFDQARIVSWEPWQPATLPLVVPSPGNQRFLQFRVAAAAPSLSVTWEDGQVRDPSAGVEPPPRGGADPAAAVLSLSPPRPNPFRATAGIEYRLPRNGRVRLTVHDVGGRLVEVLVDEVQSAGLHRAEWRGRDLPAGLYFCRLAAGGTVRTEKLVRLR